MAHGLDSVASDKTIYELFIARELYNQIENNRRALPKSLLDWMQTQLTIPAFRDYVLQQHEKYEALASKDFSKFTCLLSTDKLEGLTEGEQILRELIAPWKGKIILIDVWGTWCRPCKDALAHSQELYERMKPYDIYFLYMANRSDETSWKNVIKEYNVSGENVGHVNLPVEQQEAVERFLKVNKYPSYFLIGREGHLLDVNADPRNMDAFEELVKGMGK
jgi:thiol-disulfide isomerase/thioredoxin